MPRFNASAGTGDTQRPAAKSLADAMLHCNSVADLRALAPLPKDAQEQIDQMVVQVGLDRLVIVGDLLAEGLVYTLNDPLGVLEVYWEKEAKIGHAIRTMLPSARGEDQLPERTGVRVPIYVTMDDFSINIRTIRAAERSGAPLDTSMVAQATRRVNEAIEDAAINGAGIAVAGNSAPGIFNAPNVNAFTYGSGSWSSATGEQMLADVLNMIDDLQSAKMYGPYNLYVNTTYGNQLNDDFKANSGLTVRQRLEEIEVGGRNLRIRTADQLATDRTCMIQMTTNVIDVIVGQQPVAVSWASGSGWERYFAVMAFIIPRVKDDYDGNSGILTGNV